MGLGGGDEVKKRQKPTPKQERFCQCYTVHWNATRAAKESGYSEKTAMEQGYQLLQNPSVQARIDEITAHALREIGISRERVLSELGCIAFFDLGRAYDDNGNLLNVADMDEEVRRGLAGIKVFEEFEGFGKDRIKVGETRELKTQDKPRSLELLGKHLKLFTDKVEHSGSIRLEEIVAGYGGDELD